MKYEIIGDKEILKNPLLKASVVNMVALRNATITGVGILQTPIEENQKIKYRVDFAEELNKEQEKEFKEGINSLITNYFKLAKVDLEIRFEE
ncbi:hypothetical protein [Macrococcus armenti]|uniref:hypothetical protein n=1 Tax=Macrococcus armenti TaxID=2875764 RepID=UPI001CCCA60F|nr:hypothetical protein [Macrococcus armenti]UBH16667.1 hypothetical protein LAU44_12370 [Macrococcus armenti]UBH18937.1 hypothetical protein LAU39_11925 [Macrococcus armenti]UBH21300.1 hypothetical protein LAU40_12405 [Macrococcus armenti]